GTVRPRAGRLERDERAAPIDDRRDARHEHDEGERGHRRGRPPLRAEFDDLGRGAAFAGAETIAIALDVTSRVLRGAIDRAFDEDYQQPGDIVRGIAGEAALAASALVAELRHGPRHLSPRFDSAVRSPRAEQGERARRASASATPADSPATRDK